MKKLSLILVSLLMLASSCQKDDPDQDIVYFPDEIFLRILLIGDDVDTNGDSLISYAEAELITKLYMSNVWDDDGGPIEGKFITDLTGIEAFKNLDTLHIACHKIEHLDLSNNTSLIDLWAEGNSIKSINVSNCTKLTSLNISENSLGCNFGNLQITSMDLSTNIALKSIGCGGALNLSEVCVWTMPFPPPGVEVDTSGSPNVYFTTDCSK